MLKLGYDISQKEILEKEKISRAEKADTKEILEKIVKKETLLSAEKGRNDVESFFKKKLNLGDLSWGLKDLDDPSGVNMIREKSENRDLDAFFDLDSSSMGSFFTGRNDNIDNDSVNNHTNNYDDNNSVSDNKYYVKNHKDIPINHETAEPSSRVKLNRELLENIKKRAFLHQDKNKIKDKGPESETVLVQEHLTGKANGQEKKQMSVEKKQTSVEKKQINVEKKQMRAEKKQMVEKTQMSVEKAVRDSKEILFSVKDKRFQRPSSPAQVSEGGSDISQPSLSLYFGSKGDNETKPQRPIRTDSPLIRNRRENESVGRSLGSFFDNDGEFVSTYMN